MSSIPKDRRIPFLVLTGLVVGVAFVWVLLGQRGDARRCYTTDPAAPSATADPALFAAAAEASGQNRLAVEMVQGELLGARKAIAVHGAEIVTITGWAVDVVSKHPAGAVLVRVDGAAAVRADTCGDRPDVARAFNEPTLRRVGFGVRLGLYSGFHHLAFDALSSDGRTISRDAGKLDVIVGSRPVPTAPAVIQGGFTYLDDAAIPPPVLSGGAFPHAIGTDLRVAGWVVDRTLGVAAMVRSVDILIDGRPVDRAAYGASRPDVGSFVGVPNLQNAGFTARIFTDDLRPGRHSLTLRAVVADGRMATLGSALVIDLTQPVAKAP